MNDHILPEDHIYTLTIRLKNTDAEPQVIQTTPMGLTALWICATRGIQKIQTAEEILALRTEETVKDLSGVRDQVHGKWFMDEPELTLEFEHPETIQLLVAAYDVSAREGYFDYGYPEGLSGMMTGLKDRPSQQEQVG